MGKGRREEGMGVKSGNSKGGLTVKVEFVWVDSEVVAVGTVGVVEVVGDKVLKNEVIKCDIFKGTNKKKKQKKRRAKKKREGG